MEGSVEYRALPGERSDGDTRHHRPQRRRTTDHHKGRGTEADRGSPMGNYFSTFTRVSSSVPQDPLGGSLDVKKRLGTSVDVGVSTRVPVGTRRDRGLLRHSPRCLLSGLRVTEILGDGPPSVCLEGPPAPLLRLRCGWVHVRGGSGTWDVKTDEGCGRVRESKERLESLKTSRYRLLPFS